MNLRRFTDTGEWTTRRYLALLGSILIWGIVAIDAWYLWPTSLRGSTSMVIVSGVSMEPTYFTGDLVIARKADPSVGDVIVYAPTGLGGAQIVHRIIGGNATDGWQMQGDNNDFIDPYTPKDGEVKGVVMVHYANFGRVTVLLLNPVVWAFLLMISIVLLVWWSGDSCEDEPEERDGDDEDKSGDAGPGDGGTTSEPQGMEPPELGVASPESQPTARQQPVHVSEAAVPRGVHRATMAAARTLAAGLAGLLALGLAASPASASQLTVNAAGSTSTMSYAHCANQTLAATVSGAASSGSYTSVALSGIAPACQGQATTVTLYSAAGAQLATGTVIPAAATATVGTGTYVAANVNTVIVTVNGWHFVSTWTSPVTPPPSAATCVPTNSSGAVVAGTCTVSDIVLNTPWGSPGSRQTNGSFKVNSSTGFFKVTFDFSQAPFPGWNPHSMSGNLTLPPVSACSALPSVTVLGPSWSVFQGPSYAYYFGFSESSGNICP